MYKVYGTVWSNPYRRVISLLEQEQLAYEVVDIDIAQGEHLKPDFLALNPNHQVPVLDDDGFVLYESNAILRYLCNRHELDHWYSQTPKQRGLTDQWLDWGQSIMLIPVYNIVFHGVFAGEMGNQKLVEAGMKKLPDIWAVLKRQLEKQAYLTGDQPSIADLSVYSNVFQLKFARIKPDDQAIVDWAQRMISLPGVAASLPPRN